MSAGGLVALEAFGSGDPLVLIHGLAASRQVWDSVVPELAVTHQVVTLDLPGFGQSVPVGAGFDLEAVAGRIAQGLAAHGVLSPFDLVGHSLGAGVAVALAAARPGSVRRLVLVAPAGFAPMPRLASIALAAAAEQLLAGRRRLAPLTDLSWGRRLLLAFAAADGATIPPTQARMIVDSSASAQRTAEALATITTTDLRSLLPEIPAPLGLIWGTEDRTVPARTAAVVRAARPDAELELIERGGHIVMVERPEEFVAALLRLLARLDRDATTSEPGRSTLV